MKKVTIAIGADHRGFLIKNYLIKELLQYDTVQINWIDVGAFNEERSDYPIFSVAVVHEMLQGKAQYGVLICGTGVGMAVTANRFAGIYAGLAWNETVARANKEDDNCNILVFPADFITQEEAKRMTLAWLTATFKEGRYAQRIRLIDDIKKRLPCTTTIVNRY